MWQQAAFSTRNNNAIPFAAFCSVEGEQINSAVGGFGNVISRCPRSKRTAVNNAWLVEVQKLKHHCGNFALGIV